MTIGSSNQSSLMIKGLNHVPAPPEYLIQSIVTIFGQREDDAKGVLLLDCSCFRGEFDVDGVGFVGCT